MSDKRNPVVLKKDPSSTVLPPLNTILLKYKYNESADEGQKIQPRRDYELKDLTDDYMNLLTGYNETKVDLKKFQGETEQDGNQEVAKLELIASIKAETVKKIEANKKAALKPGASFNENVAKYTIYSEIPTKFPADLDEKNKSEFLKEKISKARASVIAQKIMNKEITELGSVENYLNGNTKETDKKAVKNLIKTEMKSVPEAIRLPNNPSIFPIDMTIDKDSKLFELTFTKPEAATIKLEFKDTFSGIEMMESIQTMGLFNFMKIQLNNEKLKRVEILNDKNKFNNITNTIKSSNSIEKIEATSSIMTKICNFSDLTASNSGDYKEIALDTKKVNSGLLA